MKALSPLPLPGKTLLLFGIFGLFLPRNGKGSQIKELESKFDKILQISKNILVPTFSGFAAIDHKGHFRKFFNWILKFGYELGYRMQKLMLNRLTPISNPKNQKPKARMPFSNCPFSF